jgi:hypothetical protein
LHSADPVDRRQLLADAGACGAAITAADVTAIAQQPHKAAIARGSSGYTWAVANLSKPKLLRPVWGN